jgi:hypothetical protein
VAYQLSLPENLSAMHDVFLVSQLKKCLRVLEEQLPTEDLEVQEDLTYIEKPTQILETADRVTRRSTIRMCKVKWGHHVTPGFGRQTECEPCTCQDQKFTYTTIT